MNDLSTDFQNIAEVLRDNYNKSTINLWKNDEWHNSTNFTSTINAYYNNYTGSNVTCPNPSGPQHIPVMYCSNLGPLDNSTSYAGSIYLEYTNKIIPIINTMLSMSQVTLNYTNSTNSSSEIMNNSLTSMLTFTNGTEQIKTNIDNWVVDNQPQLKSSWRSFTFGIVVWGWFICIGVLITVYSQAMSKPALAHGLCCFWLFTGLIAVTGFLASAGSLGIGLVTENACGLLDDLFTKDGIAIYDIIIPSRVVPYVDTCLNEGGDLATYLNLTESFAFFNQLKGFNSTLAGYKLSPSTGNFKSIAVNAGILSSPINYFNVPDPSVLPQNTPKFNLDYLNSLTNNNTVNTAQSNCTQNFTQDLWVFSIDSCGEYPYLSSDVPTSGRGSKSCLIIKEWSQDATNVRYASYFSCSYPADYLSAIDTNEIALNSYQLSVDQLYGNMSIGLSEINSTINNMTNFLIAQNALISNYYSSPDQLLYLMNSAFGNNPAVNGLNCSYVHSYSLTLKQAMCTNSLENIYQVFVFIFVLSFFMLVLELINLYLSRALLKGEEIY